MLLLSHLLFKHKTLLSEDSTPKAELSMTLKMLRNKTSAIDNIPVGSMKISERELMTGCLN